jgi:UDPglucose--hexose-1-phosphate uridylyltransferase
MSMQSHSHRRLNLLTGEWVLVSPQRAQRPWQGQVEEPESGQGSTFDPDCYLCPGNARVNGHRNPEYSGPYAFDNDFPALSAQSGLEDSGSPLLVTEPENGCCRVACFSERHDLRLATMDEAGVAAVLKFLFEAFRELDARPDIGYVQVFENRGAMMGCSNPHPHAQIWATRGLPLEPTKELDRQVAYFQADGRSLLADYLETELSREERLVCANEHAVSLVPFWATWPYETLLLPRRAVSGPDELAEDEVDGLAGVLRQTLVALERLFATAVPYSMGFHPRPSDGRPHPEWQFHAHIYPPLLRSASVRKHMVGFEMLGTPQRDIMPETAARNLRDNLVLRKSPSSSHHVH